MPTWLWFLLRVRIWSEGVFREHKRFVVAHAERHAAKTILIEDKASGTMLLQDLRREGAVRPIAISPEGDKIMRMYVHSPLIEAGNIYLPREASWLAEFQAELLQFLNGKYDDQVDSMSQYLSWAKQPQKRLILSGGYRRTAEFRSPFSY